MLSALLQRKTSMWTKLIIVALFAVSALLTIIWYGMKTTDLDDAQGTLPVGEFVDPKSVSLRGRRPLDPNDAATLSARLSALLTNFFHNEFATNVQTDASQPKVSYVTSFWAQQKGSKVHPHRLEVRASLLANILNPHFDQVVIFLDGVNESDNCPLFIEGMVERALRVTLPTTSISKADLYSKVTCVGSPYGQPNYYQMFQNTVSDYVTGDIVVMANADQAFDNTMALARRLNPEVLISLGTRGYTGLISADADYFYKQVVGRVRPEYLDPGENEKKRAPDSCMRIRGSVDTWIFHKSKLKETLRPEPFQRRGSDDKMEFFFMNENQAENAAIWALNQCYQFQSNYHACEKIHSWHFHLTGKTHHKGGRVGQPWNHPSPSKRAKCVEEGNCFL